MLTILPVLFPIFLRIKKSVGKSRNVWNKLPFVHDLLPKSNASKDHQSTILTQKRINDKQKSL